MIKNYFKLAIKVLGRRKFFTFISLFGISFTLTILMVITAFLETELGTQAPLTEKERMLFLPHVSLKRNVMDTIPSVDSTMLDGTVAYDTTYTYSERTESNSTSSPSYPFLDKYMRDLPHVEKYSFYSPDYLYDLFLNSNKLTLSAIKTDAAYWEIFDFEFIEGQPYRNQQVENQEQVVIITTKTRDAYFGENQPAMGKEMILDGKHFTVTGIIKTPNNYRGNVIADAFMPYTTDTKRMLLDNEYRGGFEAVFLTGSERERELLRAELDHKATLIPLPDPENFNILELPAISDLERYAVRVYYQDDPEDSVTILGWVLVILLALFVLLPTLNLVNLNISRILERSSEIGVRKSFGASSRDILFQFIFENIVLTLIGGIIGFAFALLLIYLINDSEVLVHTTLTFNPKVFFWSLLICLLFGILSGLIPAFRMSRLSIINALKQNIR